MDLKIKDIADSNYNMPVLLKDVGIEDAGIVETLNGECDLIIMTIPSKNGMEILLSYKELKEIMNQMEENM